MKDTRTPAEINREIAALVKGMDLSNKKVCIYTMYNDTYAPFVDMFEYCVQKAYPDYHVWSFKCQEQPECRRFLNEIIDEYDYVLIIDIDILIRRETPTLLEQHLAAMLRNGTHCYDNYAINNDRVSGVHFVTKAWWDKTHEARMKWAGWLEQNKDKVYKDFDEVMLRNIIIESELPPPSPRTQEWNVHGIHLGKFRKSTPNSKLRANGLEKDFWNELRYDQKFIELWNKAKSELPYLTKIEEVLNA